MLEIGKRLKHRRGIRRYGDNALKRNRVLGVIVGLLFVEFLSGGVWGIHRGLSSLFTKEVLLITSFTQIGLVLSMFGLTKAVTNLGLGALSDRIGRKPIILLGIAVSGIGGAVIATSSAYSGMLIGTALIGLGGGGAFVGIMVAMIEAVASKRTGLAMGLFELAAYGGSSFGSALGGYLAAGSGLRYPFYVILALSGVGAATGFFIIPETRSLEKEEKEAVREGSKEYVDAIKRLVPLYIAGFSSKIMDSLLWSFLPLLLIGLPMSITEVTVITSAFTFSWALSQPLTGYVSDNLGRKSIILVGLFSAAVSILPFTLTRNFFLLVVLALVLGVEAALFYTPLVAMVSDIAPSALEGTLVGSYRFFRDMGYFVGPILLGAIADIYGLDYSFYVTSLSLLIATLILYLTTKETLTTGIQKTED